jgi:hypothetical protein
MVAPLETGIARYTKWADHAIEKKPIIAPM